MKPFPENVVLKLDDSPHKCRLVDGETGDLIENVTGISLDIDARQDHLVEIEVRMYGTGLTILGSAKYLLDDETMLRLAADNGWVLSRPESDT